jgi:hypothetical protein
MAGDAGEDERREGKMGKEREKKGGSWDGLEEGKRPGAGIARHGRLKRNGEGSAGWDEGPDVKDTCVLQ